MVLLDMNMPTCCADCPLFDDRYDYPTCYYTQSSRGYNFKIREKRMPDCPLDEITECKDCIFSVRHEFKGEFWYECNNRDGLNCTVNGNSFCSRSIHK